MLRFVCKTGLSAAMSNGRVFSSARMNLEAALDKVQNVDIDPQGVFKYILLKVYGQEVEGKEPCKMIVRGYKTCPFHSDIYDRVSVNLDNLQMEAECVGGGRINHDPKEKKIVVYGYSQGYGKADHAITVDLLKKKYPDYEVNWNDEGY